MRGGRGRADRRRFADDPRIDRLCAALDIATGQITGLCQPRHWHQEFLRFLKQVAKSYPTQELHLVMDNYAAHKRVEI